MVEMALNMLKADLESPNDCKDHMVQLALSIIETQAKQEKLVLEMNKIDPHMTSLMLQYRDLKTDVRQVVKLQGPKSDRSSGHFVPHDPRRDDSSQEPCCSKETGDGRSRQGVDPRAKHSLNVAHHTPQIEDSTKKVDFSAVVECQLAAVMMRSFRIQWFLKICMTTVPSR